MVDQRSRRRRLGGGGRVDDQDRRVPGRVVGRGLHPGHAGDGRQPVLERRDHGAVLCPAGQLGGHDQRAVEPRTEPVGDQVVGLAGGEVGGVVAGVGEGQAHGEQRDGEDHQHDQRGRTAQNGPALHGPAPPPPEPPLGPGRRRLEEAGHVEPVDGPTGEAEHGRQQGQGGQHHRHDGEDRPDGETVEVLLADQEQPAEGDDHGAPGEEHGPAGGGHGPDHGVAGPRPSPRPWR